MPRHLSVPLLALLAALWHAPALAQDDRGDPVDLDGGSAAGDTAEAGPEIVTSETFLFAFGALAPAPSVGDALDELVERLARDESLRLRIDAHTDNVGWALGNVELSRRRARAVALGLVTRGVAVERISARAFGESRPVASNATAEGRRRNRRVVASLVR